MDMLDREALVELARHEGWPAVSIYLPAHRAGTDTQQDPIRMKNLINKAHAALVEGGMRGPDADELLSQARSLQADPGFWREGFDGVAIFITLGEFKVFRTSVPMPERVRAADHFLIRPLVPALSPPLRFMVLALSKNRVRLLDGTADEVREIDAAGVPQGLTDALNYDDYESQVQFHSRTPAAAGGLGRRSAMFHGHGGHADTSKDDLERYFRIVDKAIKEHVGPSGTPLILAGVDYLLPIYRSASAYPNLMPETLTGNPDETPAARLHAEALALLAPYLRQELEADLATLEKARQGKTASDTIVDIVLAAHEGRVQTLFVTDAHDVWGRVELESSQVTHRDEREPGDSDLLDRATAQTLLHGGAVHVMAPDQASAAVGSSAAAVLRY